MLFIQEWLFIILTLKTTINILREIYGILNKGGKAFITVKSPRDRAEMKYLEETSERVGENVYKTGIQIKSRFTIEQWNTILQEAGIRRFTVKGPTKSGNVCFLLNEIRFSK